MKFAEQIKKIRTDRGLTQEQFAQKLNVSRQAVSNWENDRNLPDLEMLISMAEVFRISLDEMILGERNDMTEKLIRDGREAKLSRTNLILVMIGSALLILGAMLLCIKAMSVDYVDAAGVLHENFFLLPLSFFSFACGVGVFVAGAVRSLVMLLRRRQRSFSNIAMLAAGGAVLLCAIAALVLLILGNS